MNFTPNQPTKEERKKILLELLQQENREEDFPYLLEALSPPADITNIAPLGSGKNIRIGIIGGGAAGLSAAFELRKLGYDITIFDALEDRIGGRIYTRYFDSQKRYYGELGAMRLPISHETLWHYIDLFDLKTRPFIQSTPGDIFYIRHRYACNDPEETSVMRNIYPAFDLTPQEKITPWRKLSNSAINPPLLALPPAVRQEIIEIRKEYSPEIVALDSLKIKDLYQRAGLSRGAVDMLGNLSPLIGDFYYNSTMELYQEIYSLDFESLYRIEGGTTELPLAFYHSFWDANVGRYYPNIPPHLLGEVTWMDGHWVEQIQQPMSGGPVTLCYKSKKNPRTHQQTFDYIVCAIPFSTLRHVELCPLFSSDKMQAIQELTYENSFKSAHFYAQRFWENPGILCGPKLGGNSATDRPVTSLWYPSDHSQYIDAPTLPPQEPGVLLATYNYALDANRLGNLPARRRLHEIQRQIAQIHCLPKDYIDTLLLDHASVNWNDEQWFLGGFAYYSPGQKNTFSWSAKKPEYQNRVFFAGEHVSGKHAWIQGALKTGMEAANNVAMANKYK
ncbi:FAD-dependent oxidoreductase [Irregularibacter muris]|uniref:FAD-dependent oxidoreductase n=1 Tax=Irregularibacter muris TaxID=1796619 RepID=A0AAE3HEW4_9FIRM|nr:NAD(P)/FAD-dependent oxidoreductase [Irregularibacter muris]MCR1898841.1 FAD-dependent oxidoreductase [Irregularibacter muris]